MRDVRDHHDEIVKFVLGRLELLVQFLYPGRYLPHLCDEVGGVLLLPLPLPNLLGNAVALSPEAFDFLEDVPSLLVEADERAHVDLLAPLEHLSPYQFRIVP